MHQCLVSFSTLPCTHYHHTRIDAVTPYFLFGRQGTAYDVLEAYLQWLIARFILRTGSIVFLESVGGRRLILLEYLVVGRIAGSCGSMHDMRSGDGDSADSGIYFNPGGSHMSFDPNTGCPHTILLRLEPHFLPSYYILLPTP